MKGCPRFWAMRGGYCRFWKTWLPTRSGTPRAGGQIGFGGFRDQRNHALLFTVTDNGEGIPAEELPLIFERFHRVDKSRHADSNQSGLGLAIARAIVEAHGGKIWVESTAGVGTTISFELPLI